MRRRWTRSSDQRPEESPARSLQVEAAQELRLCKRNGWIRLKSSQKGSEDWPFQCLTCRRRGHFCIATVRWRGRDGVIARLRMFLALHDDSPCAKQRTPLPSWAQVLVPHAWAEVCAEAAPSRGHGDVSVGRRTSAVPGEVMPLFLARTLLWISLAAPCIIAGHKGGEGGSREVDS